MDTWLDPNADPYDEVQAFTAADVLVALLALAGYAVALGACRAWRWMRRES